MAACLVPPSGPYPSEYLPAHWQGERLSGFTGSMATLGAHDQPGCAVCRQPLLDAGRGRAGCEGDIRHVREARVCLGVLS